MEWAFPNRFGHGERSLKTNVADFYSFKAFVAAARVFPDFLSGDEVDSKRELAAFLANVAGNQWRLAEAPADILNGDFTLLLNLMIVQKIVMPT